MVTNMKMKNQFWFLEYDDIDFDRYYTDDEYWKECKEKELYYDCYKKKWVKEDEYTCNWYPAHAPCHSYRAAVRHLRKHNEIPKGTRFRLCSKFVGFDRYLIK